ncbi:unnamed protein product, partial [Staurois parvus]
LIKAPAGKRGSEPGARGRWISRITIEDDEAARTTATSCAGAAGGAASMCAVQVKLELGHRAQVRKKPTLEGFTHDWMVFVRGPEHSNIQHFVEKVVFHLH